MKKIIACLAIAAGALAAPALSFAQSNGPVTRAQVRADLVAVEKAGYNPSLGNDIHYPADIQAAEARIAAQNADQTARQDVGGASDFGRSSSGVARHAAMPQACVGPVSFCTPYFGS
jgi:hypothetical protein